MQAWSVVAQIIPILMLGIVAEIRAVIMDGRRGAGLYFLVSGMCGFLVVVAILEAGALDLLARIPGEQILPDATSAVTVGGTALAIFLLCTFASALVVIHARRDRPGDEA